MAVLDDLRIRIFADGADLSVLARLVGNPLIKGFTTNPTLMRKSNVRDYRSFALELLQLAGERPVSFEVTSDEFAVMERQAREIASWGDNVYVKIPVTNSRGNFTGPLIRRLSRAGVQVNVTALLTLNQVARVMACLHPYSHAFVSIFAGRIADTGRDPVPVIRQAVTLLNSRPKAELIWASPREIYNLFQANSVGCHNITLTQEILAKLHLVGKDLEHLSLDTVRTFQRDAMAAGYTLSPSRRTKSVRSRAA